MAGWSPPEPGTRWLLRLPNWIGDAVMVLPALRALRSLPAPGQRWFGAAHPRVLDLYRATGWFEEVWPARGLRAPLGLRKAVREARPDRAVVFTEAPSGALLARVSGAPLRAGRGSGPVRRLLTHPLPAASRRRPHWKEMMEVARAAGGAPPGRPDFRLPVAPEAAAAAGVLLAPCSGNPPVALAPGAAFGPAKQWPLERFTDLARRLTGEGETVVAIGGPGESGHGAALAAEGVLDLTGRTGLLEAHAVLSRCRVLVTNDSGALHLGRAAGVPVVGVFGSSSPRWTGPEPEEGEALWLGLPCSPCFERRCPLTGSDHLRCLRDIPVEAVREALSRRAVGVG